MQEHCETASFNHYEKAVNAELVCHGDRKVAHLGF